jgi:LmbE family N-acetylglucosaminyl deacetylase
MNRRDFAVLGAATALPGLAEEPGKRKKRKIVVVGAHPDDPECGCGGVMARYADAGHAVSVVYFTRGEAGIRGKSHEEAAAIRTAEAQRAVKILGARAVFAGQIDGATEVNKARYAEFDKLLASEAPDVVFAHWPLDTHGDHCVASLAAYHAWLAMRRKPALYFFEVMTNAGRQTQQFTPSIFVDITATAGRKREAIYAHSSQNPDSYYPAHERLARSRGMEIGCRYAEAFAPAWQDALPV